MDLRQGFTRSIRTRRSNRASDTRIRGSRQEQCNTGHLRPVFSRCGRSLARGTFNLCVLRNSSASPKALWEAQCLMGGINYLIVAANERPNHTVLSYSGNVDQYFANIPRCRIKFSQEFFGSVSCAKYKQFGCYQKLVFAF